MKFCRLNNLLRSLPVAALISAIGVAAAASTIILPTQTRSGCSDIGCRMTNDGARTQPPVALDFTQFDPTSGALTSVSISSRSVYVGPIAVQNVVGAEFNQATLTLFNKHLVGTEEVFSRPTNSVTFGAGGDFSWDFFGFNQLIDPSRGLTFETTVLTDPTSLALFTGGGLVTLSHLWELDVSVLDGSADWSVSETTAAAFSDVFVTYEYDSVAAVPLPSSMALMAACIGALAWMGRRKVTA